MSDKLRGSTTVVTENRVYLVDRNGRRGVQRSNASAKSKSVSEIEVEVTQTQPHLISRHSNKFLQITTAFPVIATFIPGTPEVEQPELPGSSYTTGVLYVDKTVKADSQLQISLYDPDVAAKTAPVIVFNAVTGETENLTLCRLENGLFRNTIGVKLSMTKGNDFDGVMHASPNDIIRVIYNDGRGEGGEPVKVVANVTVTSDFVAPMMYVRRAVEPTGNIGVIITASGTDVRKIKLTNIRNNLTLERYSEHLPEGEWWYSVGIDALNPEEGDIIRTEHAYKDLYGNDVVIEHSCVVTTGDVQGHLLVPVSAKPHEELPIWLDDPDLTEDYVDVVVSGDQTNKFVRVRLMRFGLDTGVYKGSYNIDAQFDNDASITVTYADSSAGTPKLVRQVVAIDRTVPEVPETPTPQPGGNIVEQLALQMEINGLFTLNGQFSGVIKLRSKENETVRCSIIQAS